LVLGSSPSQPTSGNALKDERIRTLREWLAPYRKHRGNLCPIGLRKRLEADRDKALLREDWPSNALRHSFGSYHLAQFKGAAAPALQMGNSPAMIFKHYRELVKPKDAENYWRIRPLDVCRNVISISS